MDFYLFAKSRNSMIPETETLQEWVEAAIQAIEDLFKSPQDTSTL
ncbi:hypothetical protein [Photobacterium galatheae]|nr:hypothetical protein [Photobacterium galatheae]